MVNTPERVGAEGDSEKHRRAPFLTAAALTLSVGVNEPFASPSADNQNAEGEGDGGSSLYVNPAEHFGVPTDLGLDLDAWKVYKESVKVRFINSSEQDARGLESLLEQIDVNIEAVTDVLNIYKTKPGEESSIEDWVAYQGRIVEGFEKWEEWEEKNKHPQPPSIMKLIGYDGEASRAIEERRKAEEMQEMQDTIKSLLVK